MADVVNKAKKRSSGANKTYYAAQYYRTIKNKTRNINKHIAMLERIGPRKAWVIGGEYGEKVVEVRGAHIERLKAARSAIAMHTAKGR